MLLANGIRYFYCRKEKKKLVVIKKRLFWLILVLVAILICFWVLKFLADLGLFAVYYGESGPAPWCSELQNDSGLCPHVLK